LKKPITRTKKRAGGVAEGVGLRFKAQYHKKKKAVERDFFVSFHISI
jgi:hypothetical protein